MKIPAIDPNIVIERIEWATLRGERPRTAGANARLGEHGRVMDVSLVRITAGSQIAFGWSQIMQDEGQRLVGRRLVDMVESNGRINEEFRGIEFPLLDWIGRMAGKPVYSLVALLEDFEDTGEFLVPCYDSTLYFDDLHLSNINDAVHLMQEEALEGMRFGHRAFKVKVGRGAMHMPIQEGMERDIAILHGIRDAVGPSAPIMIDSNNTYNVNLTKWMLEATADVDIYWIEEPFHEDPVLFEVLQKWIKSKELGVLIADGEGSPSASVLDWAEQGLIDVLQYDTRYAGFSYWLDIADRVNRTDIIAAPHNYGGLYGNYASCHLASVFNRFSFVEWDEANADGLDASGYSISDGKVHVPASPGFGLELDHTHFSKRVKDVGWSIGV